jgi:glucose/arabinose dehydrogenase
MRIRLLILLMLLVAGHANAVTIQKIVGNLARPVDIVSPRDGTNRLFIVLQEGKIVIFNGTKKLSKPFLDITSAVSCCGERGLLSLAFHPDYTNNGFFYIHYTNRNGDLVIARYQVSEKQNVAKANSKLVLLTVPHSTFSNHNGGKVVFGPDGYLYLSFGDGGGAGDTSNNAQNLGQLLGKILRIDVNSGNPYSIPPTNPFVGRPGARPEIWAYGLRNPWRISFDRKKGTLYIADVGQNTYEEVNFQKATSKGGKNYGWRLMEGKHCFNPTSNCNPGNLKKPILEYSHSQGCSITGGYVYRGTAIPSLKGFYLYSDYCSGIISKAKKKNGVWTNSELLSTEKRVSTFGENEAGEILFAHHDETAGEIYQIVP